VLAIKFSLTLW